jgi:hypothetical protein
MEYLSCVLILTTQFSWMSPARGRDWGSGSVRQYCFAFEHTSDILVSPLASTYIYFREKPGPVGLDTSTVYRLL